MTFGSGLAEQGDLAALMSAQEDRFLAGATSGPMMHEDPSFDIQGMSDSDGVNYSGGSSYSDDLPLSSNGLVGTPGAGGGHLKEMRASLCSNLGGRGLDGLLKTIGTTDTYLTLMRGKAWPSVLNQGRISAGYITPTVIDRNASINKGWNAAAQPGAAPGFNIGYSDKSLGPSTYAEAMLYSPAPLTDQLGALQNFEDIPAVDPAGIRKVLEAAKHPGTEKAGAMARELLAQSVKIGDITGKRAAVMENARKSYRGLLLQVSNLDSETQRIASHLFDADGDINLAVATAERIKAYTKLRQKAFALGREAIRYQKTNVLATGLTKNGYAQAKLLQDMAMTLMTGKPRTTAVLAAQFDNLARESSALKSQRLAQVAQWKSNDFQSQVKKAGLGEFSSPIQKAVTSDYWEADLAGMEVVEMAYLGELALCCGLNVVKKAAKSVGRAVSSAASSVSKAASSASRAASRASGLNYLKKIGKRVSARALSAANRAAKSTWSAARKTATAASRRVASAAKRAASYSYKKIGSPIVKTVRSVSKPAWSSIKAGARIATEPLKMTYQAGRHIAQGDFRAAANSIARSVKNTANNIATAAASMTIGMQCAFDKSPLGKATAQAVGQAVGTAYGGAVGGAVGKEAGRKGNQASQGICAGMDRIGLTRGRIRPGQIGPAFKQTASRLAKQTFSPKELLKSGTNIASNYASGGASSIPGTDFLQKQSMDALMKKGQQYAVKYGKKRAQQYVQRELQNQIQRNVIDKNPTLRKLSRATPYIQQALRQSGAFTGGRVNMDVLKKTMQAQTSRVIQNTAKRYGTRLATQAARRIDPRYARMLTQAQRVAQMSPQQRNTQMVRFAQNQAIARARALARQRMGVPGALLPA